MGFFSNRIIRILFFDKSLYQELETDKWATIQALLVVVLSSLAAGFGNLGIGKNSLLIIIGLITAFTGWFAWAYITYLIALLFKIRCSPGKWLRIVGLSTYPGLLKAFGALQPLIIKKTSGLDLGVQWYGVKIYVDKPPHWFSGSVSILALILIVIAMVIAVKRGFSCSFVKAGLVCVTGWITYTVTIFFVLLSAPFHLSIFLLGFLFFGDAFPFV